MDRRSWLWRRRSSEKSPGETESSGSISSLSERFSDEQVYATQAAQSLEVTFKATPNEEEFSTPKKNKVVADVKTLTDKLAAALLNISAKEDLVIQHSKVAEEAVLGWEKAENEVISLKLQLDAAKQKNSNLEDQVGHLDGALKECMRQLRQARDEQEQKIQEAIANKCDWECKKSDLEGKVFELEALLQTAKTDVAASVRSDLQQQLKAVEKENSSLKLELQSRLEELEFRIAERDLSAEAAETASRQHLESVKKVAKLEAECRRLKAIFHKTFPPNDHRSLSVSSVYVESFADRMSDSGEMLLSIENDMHKLGSWDINEYEPSRADSWSSSLVTELDQFKNKKATGKNHTVHSTEINLMDDFLEVERLAALPDADSGSNFIRAGVASDQPNFCQGPNKAEVEAMIQKNTELEKKLQKMEADKLEVLKSLTRCKMQLEASHTRIGEAELKVTELQTQLALANKSNQEAREELKATKTKKEIAESKLRLAQTTVEELTAKICSLEEEIQKERALSLENLIKCGKLEDELSRMKNEVQAKQDTEILHNESVDRELKLKQEKELALAARRFATCQKTIASLGQKLKSLAALEDFLLDSDEQLKLHHSDLSSPKRGSESAPIWLSSSVPSEKNRNSLGKLAPRSKSVSRRRNR